MERSFDDRFCFVAEFFWNWIKQILLRVGRDVWLGEFHKYFAQLFAQFKLHLETDLTHSHVK